MLWPANPDPSSFLPTRVQLLSEMEGLGQTGVLITTQDKSLFLLASRGILSL